MLASFLHDAERRRLVAPLVSALAALMALAVYVATLAPTVGYGDGPELTLAALELGVPHPTGYPLYTLLGAAWIRLWPLEDAAWRMNLFSAFCAAGAVGLLAGAMRRLSGSAVAGWLGALLLAFSPRLWSQATLAEVYALHVLCVALVLYALVRFQADGRARWLRLTALALGLGCAHHGMTLLLVPLVILAACWRAQTRSAKTRSARTRIDLHELGRLFALAAAPLLLYAYLPLAASRAPAIAWGNPVTARALWFHVSGGQYRGFLALPGLAELPALLASHFRTLAVEFGPWFLAIAALGLWHLWRSARPLALGTSIAYVVTLAYAFSYRISDAGPYVLPAFAFYAVWIAAGAGVLLAGLARPAARALACGLALVPLLWMLRGLPERDRSRQWEPHDRTMAALSAAPPGALLLVQGPTGYAPVYASLAQGVRADVQVVDMFLRLRPRYAAEFELLRRSGATPSAMPRDLRVAEAAVRAGRAPVLLWPDAPDLDWDAAGLLRVRRGAFDELMSAAPDLRAPASAGARPIRFGEAVEFLGAEPESARVAPGSVVRLRLHWRRLAAGDFEPHSVVLAAAEPGGDLLLDARGRSLWRTRHALGQGVALDDYAPGESFAESLVLLVPRTLAAGRYELWLGVATREGLLVIPGGRRFVAATALDVVGQPAPRWSLTSQSAATTSQSVAATSQSAAALAAAR